MRRVSVTDKEKGWMSLMKSINLQDVFLNQARLEKIPVTIFLINGFQFKGTAMESKILCTSMPFLRLLLQNRSLSWRLPIQRPKNNRI